MFWLMIQKGVLMDKNRSPFHPKFGIKTLNQLHLPVVLLQYFLGILDMHRDPPLRHSLFTRCMSGSLLLWPQVPSGANDTFAWEAEAEMTPGPQALPASVLEAEQPC